MSAADDSGDARVPAWRRYLRFWGRRVGADVDDELSFHVDMLTREYVRRGMTEPVARDAAYHRLGNLHIAREACLTIGHRRTRRMTRAQTLDALVHDVRFTLRTLGRQKAWTAVAVITLALGIGASTAVFSVVNSLLLHPLAYRDANRVVTIWQSDAKSGIFFTPDSKMLDGWRRESHSFEAIQEYSIGEMTLSGAGDAAVVETAAVDSGFLGFTGIRLLRGRAFAPSETHRAGTRLAVISEQLWRDRFGSAPDVVGRTIQLNDNPFTVIGVAPAKLQLPAIQNTHTDVWLPFGYDTLRLGGTNVARLRPGLSDSTVARELDAINERDGLNANPGTMHVTVRFRRPSDMVGFRPTLYLLSIAVALLLLVACANVSHLLLARGAAREREIAIRTALGAGRWRLARQLLTESLILAGLGCVGGLLFGLAAVQALLALSPPALSQLALTHLDFRAVAVATLVSLATGVAFGCMSAMHAIRRTTADSLRGMTSSTSGAARTQRVRSFLVVTEMALSALLLVGAVLLVRSVIKLQNIDPGFATADLYSMKLELPASRYPTAAERRAFAADVADRARKLPGVVGAGLSMHTPPMAGFMIAPLEGEGATPGSNPRSIMATNTVSSDYFRLLGAHLRGASFDAGSASRDEVIINEGMAGKLWPGQDAIGKRLRFHVPGAPAAEQKWMRIVGVAGNVAVRGMSLDHTDPVLYYPFNQDKWPAITALAVRVSPGLDPASALREIVRQLAPSLPPPPVHSVADDLAETIATQRFTMTLLAVFAVLAVLLSAVGLYGLISYTVTQRRREIGIRIALGATPSLVARAVVARALMLSVIGLAIGLVTGIWATKLIKSALYGVTGTDAPSYAATAVLLLAISVLSCLVPMRRAMAVDPAIAMRGD